MEFAKEVKPHLMALPRTNNRLKFNGIHFVSWEKLAEDLHVDERFTSCVFSDLSLGAHKGHWILNELNAQLGMKSRYPNQPLIGIQSEKQYSDTISRIIDNESIGDINFQTAYDGCKTILRQIQEQDVRHVIIIPPNQNNGWESEDKILLRLLSQALDGLLCNITLIGYPNCNLGDEWDVRFENTSPLRINIPAEIGIPGVLDPELGKLCSDLIKESAVKTFSDFFVISPLSRVETSRNNNNFLYLINSKEKYSHLKTYFELKIPKEYSNIEQFQLEAAKRFSEGAYSIALKILSSLKPHISDPLVVASITSQIQNIRIALLQFSNAADEELPSDDLPEMYKASLYQAKAWGLVMTNRAAEAETYFELARNLLSEEEQPIMYLYLMNISALNKMRIGEIDIAFQFEQLIEEKLTTTYRQQWHISYINFINQARLYKKVRNLEQAEIYYRKAFQINDGLKVESDFVYTNFCLYQLENLKENFHAAYLYLLKTCLHWLSNETPEALAPRVAQAILSRNLSSELGRVEEISKRLIELINESMNLAGIQIVSSDVGFDFIRMSKHYRADIGFGRTGLGVFAGSQQLGMGYSGRNYNELKRIVSNCLILIFPEISEYRTIYTDTQFGQELPSTSKQMISSCVNFQVEKLIFDDKKYVLTTADHRQLLLSSSVSLSSAISSAIPSNESITVFFKRYIPPIKVHGIERKLLNRIKPGITVKNLASHFEDDDLVLSTLQTMQEKKLITVHL